MKALISVYDKTRIVEFAQKLIALSFDIIGSRGTVAWLAAAGIPARDIAEIVGGGPILGHKVVTLSREIHAGLLASKEERPQLKRRIPWIDLVCVDLYPLVDEIRRPGSTRKTVIEQTDIGGPTMLRSAAKGRRIIVCRIEDREWILNWLKAGQPHPEYVLECMAAIAEKVVADYVSASAIYIRSSAEKMRKEAGGPDLAFDRNCIKLTT